MATLAVIGFSGALAAGASSYKPDNEEAAILIAERKQTLSDSVFDRWVNPLLDLNRSIFGRVSN